MLPSLAVIALPTFSPLQTVLKAIFESAPFVLIWKPSTAELSVVKTETTSTASDTEPSDSTPFNVDVTFTV